MALVNQRPAEKHARAVAGEAAHGDTAAGRYDQAGHPDRAETLRREAAILRAALGESPPQSGSGP